MNDKQSKREVEQDEIDRAQAASVIAAAFPIGLKRWGRSRYAISRARNGSADNPLYRLRVMVRRGRKVGMTRDEAMLIAADVLAVIEREWGESQEFTDAAVNEQHHSGRENDAQTASLIDRRALPAYVLAAKAHVAVELCAIAAAEREILRAGRAA